MCDPENIFYLITPEPCTWKCTFTSTKTIKYDLFNKDMGNLIYCMSSLMFQL